MNDNFNANGRVIYRGPSMLDGQRIVVVATGFTKKSNNDKTGNMIQTWILLEDVSPADAVNSGADSSVCGDCKHRGEVVSLDGKSKNINRSCYVTIWQAPRNVWESYHRGIYQKATLEELADLCAGFHVRIGSYGDPAAVPTYIWSEATGKAPGFTGYTHQWRTAPRELAQWCMASADTVAEYWEAKKLGYRIFRVATDDFIITGSESRCPASKEMGNKTDCQTCGACAGLAVASRDKVIKVHGSAAKINAAVNRLAA
tara:strand:+ start:526 stop:1299 length:774 start_codon:yes stop_codon:yes gene_type:complete